MKNTKTTSEAPSIRLRIGDLVQLNNFRVGIVTSIEASRRNDGSALSVVEELDNGYVRVKLTGTVINTDTKFKADIKAVLKVFREQQAA